MAAQHQKVIKMNKSNITIVLLLAIILAGAYKFIIKGNVVVDVSDERTTIALKEGERNFILGEMRALLGKIQRLVTLLAHDDMAAFTKLSKQLKDESGGEIQQSLIGKMPIAFKQMSRKIHADFNKLYEDAVEKNDKEHSLKQVSDLMLNCVACHSTYRFQVKEKSS